VVVKKKRASLLDDEDVAYVEDDGATESSGDVCRRCELERSAHDEVTGECPDGRGKFKEGA
jgi:hypothetical protein